MSKISKMIIPMETDHFTARAYETRAEWLAARQQTIGASDVPIILGLTPPSWGSAADVWESKVSPPPDDDSTDNADVSRGTMSESHIRELFRIETGLVVLDGTGIIFTSKKYPWLSCSLDAILLDDKGDIVPVEIKSVRYTKKWAGEDIPIYYIYQMAVHLMVTGARREVFLPRIIYDFAYAADPIEKAASATKRERPALIRRKDLSGQFAGIARTTKKFMRYVTRKERPLPTIKF